MRNTANRREFLKQIGLSSGGLVIGLNVLESCVQEVVKLSKEPDPLVNLGNRFEIEGGKGLTDFIQIRPDGYIFISLTKYEMGQGVSTGLTAILAEELEADWEKIKVRYIKSSVSESDITGGSTSTLLHWELLRKAGAFAKELLIKTAAKTWGVQPAACYAQMGYVYQHGGNQRSGYGALVDKVVVPSNYRELFEDTPLKFRSKFRLVGKALKSKTIPEIVTGKHPYSIDVQLPQMKYAAILRCPVFKGRLIDYDDSAALQVPGVEKVVVIQGAIFNDSTHIRDGLAVIANSTWAAFQGKLALTANWDLGERADMSHEQFVSNCLEQLDHAQGKEILVKGDTIEDIPVDRTISQTYEFPYQHHACMEPLNATSHYKGDSCEMWIGTQSADKIIDHIEQHLGIPKAHITIHCHPSGGGFGLRYISEYGLESMLVSKAAGGALVKLCYSREDDIQFDYPNPFELNRHSIGIKDGKPVYWDFKNVMANWGELLGWMYYDIENRRATEVKVDGFTQVGPWRSVMANAEGFSTECFIDEVAVALERDPLEFRLSLLPKNKMMDFNHSFPCHIGRLRGTLELAAKKAEWGKAMPENSAQGIAVYPYMHGNGYGSVVAEVSEIGEEIKVTKIVTTIDCGLVINPDLVKQQMVGGIIWALSAIFYGGTEYTNGAVQRSNFHDNRVLRMDEVPEIEVHICENDEDKPWGAGEIAGPPTYAAVCNAIHRLTGKRLRKLPISKKVSEL